MPREHRRRRPPAPSSDLPRWATWAFERRWLWTAGLAAFAAILWARTFRVPILHWDDQVYYFEDPRLTAWSVSNLGKILTRSFFGNFHPVTTLTFALDRAVWGSWVPGFHVAQLLFYLGGSVGLFYLFEEVLENRKAALFAATAFAAHAIHVESVAWLASRKDVVCLFFYAPALLFYLRYQRSQPVRWRLFLASLVCAALAMLSKGYAVVLPAVLVAADLCFLPKLRRRQWIDKLPYAALSVFTIALTIAAQSKDSALTQVDLSSLERTEALLKIFALYVGRALLPVGLCASYQLDRAWLGLPEAALGLGLLSSLGAGFLLLRRRAPALAWSIALFVLPLATVMNVFFTLRIWIADRYLFLPTIGSCLTLGSAGLNWVQDRPSPGRRRIAKWAAASLVFLYSVLTWERIEVWTDPVVLWSDVLRNRLEMTGSGPLTAEELDQTEHHLADLTPLMNLVQAYQRSGSRQAEALLKLLGNVSPAVEGGELDLARADLRFGRPDDAIGRLKPLIAAGDWRLADAWTLIGLSEEKKGRLDQARSAYRSAIQAARSSGRDASEPLLDLAALEFRAGAFAKAADGYKEAGAEAPTDPRAAFFLGRSLEEMGKVPEAIPWYRRALELSRADGGKRLSPADVLLQQGIAAEKLGQPSQAADRFEEVLQLAPDHPQAASLKEKVRLLRGGRPIRP